MLFVSVLISYTKYIFVLILLKINIDLAGDSNVQGFVSSNSIFHLRNRDKCKDTPRTPQDLICRIPFILYDDHIS